MSLRDDVGKKYEKLPELLEPYIEALEEKDEHLKIEGKLLEKANREQPAWLSFYDQRRIELHTYVKFFDLELIRVRAKLLKALETYPRQLNDGMKLRYVEGEDEYSTVYELYLQVKEIYDEYEGVVNAFIQRGYSLRNITDIRVNSLEDVII